jgi:predicted Rossmann fold nucleotide-binding protein DprA/Smf involved in DNA uptake
MARTPASKTTANTHRVRVLTVIQSTEGWITGQQVAALTGLTHKQTVDALNALNNAGKVARIGRKFTAKWGRIVAPDPADDPLRALEIAFRQGFFRS